MDGNAVPAVGGEAASATNEIYPVINQEKLDGGLAAYVRAVTQKLSGDRPFSKSMKLDERRIYGGFKAWWPHIPGMEAQADRFLHKIEKALHAPALREPTSETLIRISVSLGPLAPQVLPEPHEFTFVLNFDATRGTDQQCIVPPGEKAPPPKDMAIASGIVIISQSDPKTWGPFDANMPLFFAGGPGIYSSRNKDRLNDDDLGSFTGMPWPDYMLLYPQFREQYYNLFPARISVSTLPQGAPPAVQEEEQQVGLAPVSVAALGREIEAQKIRQGAIAARASESGARMAPALRLRPGTAASAAENEIAENAASEGAASAEGRGIENAGTAEARAPLRPQLPGATGETVAETGTPETGTTTQTNLVAASEPAAAASALPAAAPAATAVPAPADITGGPAEQPFAAISIGAAAAAGGAAQAAPPVAGQPRASAAAERQSTEVAARQAAAGAEQARTNEAAKQSTEAAERQTAAVTGGEAAAAEAATAGWHEQHQAGPRGPEEIDTGQPAETPEQPRQPSEEPPRSVRIEGFDEPPRIEINAAEEDLETAAMTETEEGEAAEAAALTETEEEESEATEIGVVEETTEETAATQRAGLLYMEAEKDNTPALGEPREGTSFFGTQSQSTAYHHGILHEAVVHALTENASDPLAGIVAPAADISTSGVFVAPSVATPAEIAKEVAIQKVIAAEAGATAATASTAPAIVAASLYTAPSRAAGSSGLVAGRRRRLKSNATTVIAKLSSVAGTPVAARRKIVTSKPAQPRRAAETARTKIAASKKTARKKKAAPVSSPPPPAKKLTPK